MSFELAQKSAAALGSKWFMGEFRGPSERTRSAGHGRKAPPSSSVVPKHSLASFALMRRRGILFGC
ncbi:MAG: hypothetical protein D6679_08595 [Candidatus Hydrogenedentota bacterium]|nr:MAG: hypothetical protein D6679_08595 [Candidatus Hydrogenedentota bacterium]